MRDYGKVYGTFWSSETTGTLTDDGKMLALYLMTCQHATITGVFRLPDGYAAEDLRWSPERVSEGFAELFRKGFANRCGTTKWVWIRKHLEWNPLDNPNMRKAAAKIALSIPAECAWKLDFMRACAEVLALEVPKEPNRSETVPDGFLNQEQKQKQEQEQKKNTPIPPEGAEAETGKDSGTLPDKPQRKAKDSAVGLKAWLDAVRAQGEKPVPEDDPVFAYAAKVGIPEDFLRLAWLEFRHRYTQPEAKRYRDWRAVFRKAVQGNWLKLWFVGADGAYGLTTVGVQAQRAHDERRAA